MRPSTSQAIRVQLIAGMEERAASLGGKARRVLEARLTDLRAEQPDAPSATEGAAGTTGSALASRTPASACAMPLDDLGKDFAGNALIDRATYPELPALDTFRSLWSTIRSDTHLQQAVAQTSPGAGPLNSAALVSRSMALMRDLSPGYLRQFLAYVDDLAWLEQLDAVSGAPTTKKRSRRKPK